MTASLSDQGFTYANGNTVGFANTIPTTGTYAAGDIILENKPGSALSGWKRQTTGANHVLGTDWIYFNYATQGNAPVFGARAWCVFDGTLTGTNAPASGGNVASITRTAVGTYTINFATPLPTAYYSLVATCYGGSYVLLGSGTFTTSSCGLECRVSTNATSADIGRISVVVFC